MGSSTLVESANQTLSLAKEIKGKFCTLAGLNGLPSFQERPGKLAKSCSHSSGHAGMKGERGQTSVSILIRQIRLCSGIHVVHSTAAAGHASLCQPVGRFEGRFARELRWMLRFSATCCGCKAWGETQGYPGDVRQDFLLK